MRSLALFAALVSATMPLGGQETPFPPDARAMRAVWSEAYRSAFPNGDFYFLIGDLDRDWSKLEFDRYYALAEWLGKKGFRVVIIPRADKLDAAEAAQNPRAFGIVWSSHGDEGGTMKDASGAVLPRDTFTKDRSAALKYVVLSACNGPALKKHYGLSGGRLKVIHWTGETNSDDLFAYLMSGQATADMRAALGRRFWPNDSDGE